MAPGAPTRFRRGLLDAALLTLALMSMLARPVTSQHPEPAKRPLCEKGSIPPSNRFNSTERLKSLRKVMASDLNVNWYLETGLNRMLSSPQPSEKYRSWISGFAGSSGQVLVTVTGAYLFTDSRYTLQADQELDCSWKFFDSIGVNVWVAAYNGTENITLAVDARQIRAAEYARLVAAGAGKVMLVPLNANPIDALWNDESRPKPAAQEIYPLPDAYTGQTWQEKVNRTRKAMAIAGVDFLAVTGLDETAYLLNLRATVIASVPYFPSIVLLSANTTHIFLDNSSKVNASDTLRKHLSLDSVDAPTLLPLSDLSKETAKWTGSKVWLDDTACSYSTLSAFANYTIERRMTPVQLAKAVKNPTEQMAFKKCSLLDSAALVAALSELQRKVTNGEQMSELSASSLVASYREKLSDFRGLSFETIAASGPNAAVVHYRPTISTNRSITLSEAFLLDSGGQYLGCTTDVTRTVYYGSQPPAEIMDAYTRVLMGVIDLFNLTWPDRLTSRNFDAFARHNLWSVSKDFGHGTGHGIGLFLGVHEGPNGIGRDVGLTEGNFQSIEPGYYQAAVNGVPGFGIRLETISGVKRVDPTYLRFEPVTWVPFERKLIKAQMLSSSQLSWLNWYHAECRKNLKEALTEIKELDNAAAWMTAATEPISVEVKSSTELRAGGPVLVLASLFWTLTRLL